MPTKPIVTYDYPRELITPEIAAAWLLLMCRNRKLDRAKIRAYCASMRAGRWLDGPLTAVMFDTDGVPFDGQHKLTAIVQTGISVHLAVYRNVTKAYKNVTDTGKSRNGQNACELAGHPNSMASIVAARLVISLTEGEPNLKTIYLNDKLEPWVGENPRLYDMTVRCYGAKNILSPAALAAVLYIAQCNGGSDMDEKITSFITGVTEGALMTSDDPRFVLREWAKNKRPGKRAELVVSAIISAWNAHVLGKTLRPIRNKADRDALIVTTAIASSTTPVVKTRAKLKIVASNPLAS